MDVEPLAVLWRVPSERRSRGRRGTSVQSAALIDLSVSGLQVRAPAANDLSVGAVVAIEVEGVAGDVVIRRILPVAGTRFADYGLQITPSSHELARWATRRIDAGAEIHESDWRAVLDNQPR